MDNLYFANRAEINSLYRVENFPGSKQPTQADFSRYNNLRRKVKGDLSKVRTQSGACV